MNIRPLKEVPTFDLTNIGQRNIVNICINFGLRITDEGSIPEMRIWSMLLIEFDLKMVYLS